MLLQAALQALQAVDDLEDTEALQLSSSISTLGIQHEALAARLRQRLRRALPTMSLQQLQVRMESDVTDYLYILYTYLYYLNYIRNI